MTQDVPTLCPFCAWRAHCAKRFSRGDDSSLHCPDFSEDVLLRKERELARTERQDDRQDSIPPGQG